VVWEGEAARLSPIPIEAVVDERLLEVVTRPELLIVPRLSVDGGGHAAGGRMS
jgi:hypothetical protein